MSSRLLKFPQTVSGLRETTLSGDNTNEVFQFLKNEKKQLGMSRIKVSPM